MAPVGSSAESVRPEHPRPRQLSALAALLGIEEYSGADVEISGVAAGSAEVRPGDVFFALPGAKTHGAFYAHKAVDAGAAAIVSDAAGAQQAGPVGVPVLVIDEPRSLLGPVSAWVYHTDHNTPEMFGVTGTNGKTTVAYLVCALLEQMGLRTGLSSTSERRIGEEVFESGLTTPEANHIHALLARMNEADVRAAVLEVSAHALSRHRVDGVHFDVVGFTNFSHDHLDDYGSLDEYFAAKAQLFDPDRASRGVIVLDSQWGQRLEQESRIPVVTVSADPSTSATWGVAVTERTPISTGFVLTGPQGHRVESTVPMVGDFSAVNAALAIVMVVEAGHPVDLVAHTLERDGGFRVFVPGRTELVSGDRGPMFFVDYGHTPEAFAHTLAALREVTEGRILMVFGADGDRDTTKRTDMGAIAARGADVVIVTDFHPRTENPHDIRAALLSGARAAATGADIREVADPRLAVREAISLAREGDTILYAGPGHEDYRDVGTERIAYSAREDVRLALAEAGWL